MTSPSENSTATYILTLESVGPNKNDVLGAVRDVLDALHLPADGADEIVRNVPSIITSSASQEAVDSIRGLVEQAGGKLDITENS